jgi:hypothetical protein
MGTVSREIAETLIAGNGYYPWPEGEIPEPPEYRVVKIVQYLTPEGEEAFGCVYACEVRMGLAYRYDHESEFIRSPRTAWTAEDTSWDL